MKTFFHFSFFLFFVVALFSCSAKVSYKVFDSKPIQISSKNVKNEKVVMTVFRLPKLEQNISKKISFKIIIEKNQKSKIEDGKFIFGFLSDSDFDNLKNLSPRANVSGNLMEIGKNSICISMMADSIPSGFFLQSFGNIEVKSANVEDVCIGFDFTSETPEFFFTSKGGKISPEEKFEKSIDLNEVEVDKNKLIQLKYSKSADTTGKKSSVLFVNKEKFYFRKANSSMENEIAELPTLAIKNPKGIVSIIENKEQISAMKFVSVPIQDEKIKKSNGKNYLLTPIKIDPGLVMWWPKKNWRGNDYELFEWDRFPGIILLDIKDYAVQDDFFRRIAFFVEKAGFRGKLYSDEFLEGRHGYNAHDYRAESLAEFYETARKQNFKLNEKEYLLEDILIENGVLQKSSDGKISAGRGAVISISQESPMYLRTQFIAHEGWHGIFFIDADFRNYVYSLFDELDFNTKRYLIRYFQVTPSLNYDITDEYLLRNEFMAYMLQKPVNDISKYFIDMASRQHSQEMAKEEADYVLSNKAKFFVQASQKLDEYVNKRWNLNAGRVWCAN